MRMLRPMRTAPTSPRATAWYSWLRPTRSKAAASRTVSTSGSLVTALVEEPAWSIGAMEEDVGWLFERWPAFGVDGHGCSRARGAVAGGGRSALPSAGVGPYLDPAPRCGVSSQVGGLIARLLAPQAKGDRSGAARVRLQVGCINTASGSR
jgi:hypothetical protein